MRIDAPAKINLTLEVLSRRDDGYHGVRSVMVPLAAGDVLSIEPAERFQFSCSDPALENEENLVVRAARAAGIARGAVHLLKSVPYQAGLGSASSDAAALLRAAIGGAFGTVQVDDWMATARSLGSDVPFFMAETAALVEGTGERVTPLGAIPTWYVLIVKPLTGVSTAAAYAALDARERRLRPRNASVSLQAAEALQRGDFGAVCALLHNDFEPLVATPGSQTGLALHALALTGAQHRLLCGSGSAVFALFEHEADLERSAQRLSVPPAWTVLKTSFATTPAWQSAQ